LKELETGIKAGELSRKHGVSENSIRYWHRKYGGMDISEAKRLKCLEDENRRLKQIVTDQALEITAIKDVLSKNWYRERGMVSVLGIMD